MDFQFTEEQLLLQKTLREFAEKEIAPHVADWERQARFPRETVNRLAELNLMGLPIPEEWGGAGADFVSYVIALEEISRAWAALAVILAVHTSLGCFPLLYFGSEEQKKRFLQEMAGGRKLGAFALTEPEAGSDAAGIKTRARKVGDEYVLNGSKVFISNAGEADVYLTFAVTEPGKGPRGISAFLVENDTPGFRMGPPERKMGLHASATRQLFFEDARVPAENLLGREGEGFKIAMSLLDTGRIGVGAQALGIARAAFEAARDYAKVREQFGQPIATFQGIQFMLADMATQIEAAKLLVYQAAWLKERGLPHTKEASMAKMFASDAAMRITTDAVQVFGGYGYMEEYKVERLMREAKVTQIYEGTNQIQRLVIAREILR